MEGPSGKRDTRKFVQSAKQAAADGWGYIWVDKCCIDKRNSAELSEAVNSMYRWHKIAVVCYVYLKDVYAEKGVVLEAFTKSGWFTRGWTLQELIALSILIFFDSDWHEIGSKSDPNLENLISETTSIDLAVVRGGNPGSVSMIQRMSWAAKRETSRNEDKTYSLLGLFMLICHYFTVKEN